MNYAIKGFSVVNEVEVDVFLEFPFLVYDAKKKKCWQFDLWFLCFFSIQLVHLEVLSPGTTVKASLKDFEHYLVNI